MKSKEYKRISCDLYDELEIIAMRQTAAKVVFINEDEQEETLQTKLKTIQAQNGEEFLILENEEKIRLDKLVSVKGV